MNYDSNQDVIFKIKRVIWILKKRWGVMIMPTIAALIVGISLSLALPRIYESKAVIAIQPQRVSSEFNSPISTNVADRMNIISQHILSQSYLEKIIKKCGLFSDDRFQNMLLETKIFELRKHIRINTFRSRNELVSFSIAFQGSEPEKARNVVYNLKSSFIEAIFADGIQDARRSLVFLAKEQRAVRHQLEEVEEKLKNYRKKYLKELPEQREAILRSLDRLQFLIIARRESLREARTSLAILDQQIRDRQSRQDQAGNARPDPDTPSLETYEQQLKMYRTRYTENHPTIISLIKKIEALKQAEKSQPSNLIKQEPTQPSPGSPVAVEYQRTKAEIRTLKEEIEKINLQIIKNEKVLENIPKREQELTKLKRDYQSIRNDYDNLSNQKLRAERWMKLVSTYGMDQFVTIDPARIPQAPIKPNMKLLFFGTIIAGLGAGALIIYFLEFYNQPLRIPEDSAMHTGLPLLGVIPEINTPVIRSCEKRRKPGTSILMGLSLFIVTGLLGVFAYIVFIKGTGFSGAIF